MIIPNKVLSFEKSILNKMIIILEELEQKKFNIHELYIKTQLYFVEIDEYIYSLETLYILDSINIDLKSGDITYVKRN